MLQAAPPPPAPLPGYLFVHPARDSHRTPCPSVLAKAEVWTVVFIERDCSRRREGRVCGVGSQRPGEGGREERKKGSEVGSHALPHSCDNTLSPPLNKLTVE